MQAPCGIEAILFDINGTLRIREQHEPSQSAATQRLRELLGKENVSDAYWEELTRRQMRYSQWAQENLLQLSEKEINAGMDGA
jgi:FMN phosphatase YigB (HAD superfamily)